LPLISLPGPQPHTKDFVFNFRAFSDQFLDDKEFHVMARFCVGKYMVNQIFLLEISVLNLKYEKIKLIFIYFSWSNQKNLAYSWRKE
jgi:hypothetical protein